MVRGARKDKQKGCAIALKVPAPACHNIMDFDGGCLGLINSFLVKWTKTWLSKY